MVANIAVEASKHFVYFVSIAVVTFTLLKSIWKEREMNTFPFLSYTFFPHFSPWGKMGKHTFFHGQKWGWTPKFLNQSNINIALETHFKNVITFEK